MRQKKLDTLLGFSNPSRMLRDSDGDKVPNAFDCQPNNPHKQGIVHAIKKRIERAKAEHRVKEEARERVRSGELVSEYQIRKKTAGKLSRKAALREFRRQKVREAEEKAYQEEKIKLAKKRGRAKARPMWQIPQSANLKRKPVARKQKIPDFSKFI